MTRADHINLIRQLETHVDAGSRAFGTPQSWAKTTRGLGGEMLIADILATQVNARCGGSLLFLGLDLGRPGLRYPHPGADEECTFEGFGGDIDAALFIREYSDASDRYRLSERRLRQDHLILIDSKQYTDDWDRKRLFAKAEDTLRWFRCALADKHLVGGGSDKNSIQLSYHFAHTGSWTPKAWLRIVGDAKDKPVEPNYCWWNSFEDLVLECPAEVLIGQLSILLAFANPSYRGWVPGALWQLLDPADRTPFRALDDQD